MKRTSTDYNYGIRFLTKEKKMTAKISAAFVKAQKAFNPALKSSLNPHFKSKYAGLDACVEAVIDALNDNGIGLMQQSSECEKGVVVETVFIHESGETLSSGKLHVPASKMDAQGYGSALTYARRYSLMAACGIAPEDDDGNAAVKGAIHKPTVNTAFQPDADEETYLLSVVDAVVALNPDFKAAAEKLASENLDNDEKVWVWDKLGKYSALRAGIKKHNESLKQGQSA
jgi:ERF superfamily